MAADYLSRLPSANDNQPAEIIQCFDPFQPELIDVQKADPDLQKMNHFRTKGKWPAHVTKADGNYFQNLAAKLFQDANKIVWIWLDDYKYPRTALYLPKKFCKMTLCKAHNHQFGGHNAALKTYICLTSSYYWPRIYSDILRHTKTCLCCQQRKSSTDKLPPLHPLPTPNQPNIHIHADLFGPLLAARHQHKYILCVTDTFTKYALVTAFEKKKRKQLPKPFFPNSFVNLASQGKFTPMAGKSLLKNYLENFLIS